MVLFCEYCCDLCRRARNGCACLLSLSTRKLWIEIWSQAGTGIKMRSLSTRKLWIEICKGKIAIIGVFRRFLRGSCGLKYCNHLHRHASDPSLSTRKLWIEMAKSRYYANRQARRFLRGSCGLKSRCTTSMQQKLSRFLRGSCGLKLRSFNSWTVEFSRFLRGSCGLK